MDNNIWIELKDKNILYRNLILLKGYLLSNGHINVTQGTEIRIIKKSIQELLNDDFDAEFFNNNLSYLFDRKFLNSYTYLSLTISGVEYTENLITELSNLNEDEIEIIKNNNTDKLLKFLDITSKVASTISPLINLLKK